MSPEQRPQSVATPLADVPIYCPLCEKVPLHGKQTVCSARCRIQRSMQRRVAKQMERDATVRLHLRAALDLLKEEVSPPAGDPQIDHQP
jgi:predicted nucleic acid-binding Zn ribbon protein